MKRGPQIRSLEELSAAARRRQSVFVPDSIVFRNPTPAAFAMNFCGTVLLSLMRDGLFVYIKSIPPWEMRKAKKASAN